MHIFFIEKFVRYKNSSTFALAKTKSSKRFTNGVLVQLVRIHACHAWGHGFESRTHRYLANASFCKRCVSSAG